MHIFYKSDNSVEKILRSEICINLFLSNISCFLFIFIFFFIFCCLLIFFKIIVSKNYSSSAIGVSRAGPRFCWLSFEICINLFLSNISCFLFYFIYLFIVLLSADIFQNNIL